MATWTRLGTGTAPSNTDSDLVGTYALDNATAPSDFDPAAVTSVRCQWTVTGSGFSDDSWNDDKGVALVTSGAVELSQHAGGGPTGLQNVGESNDVTDSAGIPTGQTTAAWEGASVRGDGTVIPNEWVTWVKNMGPDGATLAVSALTVTITYTPAAASVTVSPADASHGHTAAAASFTQAHTLAPDDAAHGHTAAVASLTQAHTLTPDSASHGHTADATSLTFTAGSPDIKWGGVQVTWGGVNAEWGGVPTVAPDDATHGHTAGAPGLTQAHTLTPDGAGHTHTADEPTIAVAYTLAPSDATHGHTAEASSFTVTSAIAPDDASHGHAAGVPGLTQTSAIRPADTIHTITSGSPTLISAGDGTGVPGPTFVTTSQGPARIVAGNYTVSLDYHQDGTGAAYAGPPTRVRSKVQQ